MPKILLIPEFDTFGGTRTFFKSLLEFYSSHNYEVIVLFSRDQFDEDIKTLMERCRLRYHLITMRTTVLRKVWFHFPFSALFDLYSISVFLFREKPDLVVTSTGTPGLFLGLFILPIRFLYILHTYPTTRGAMSMKSFFLNLLLNKSKVILTVSGFSRKNILKYWLTGSNSKYVQFIYNTVKKSSYQIESRHGVNSAYRILTMGHVTLYKSPQHWIEIAQEVIKRLNNMNIEFIWAGDGDLFNECNELIKNSKLKTVRFIGYQQDVTQLYKSSMIYFQPSLVENNSLSVIEAMSWGLPCVVSNAGGLPELVKDGETGYVVPVDDTERMVEEIICLITHQDIAKKMGNAARCYYEEKFSYPIWGNNMKRIHDQLLAN